MMRQAILNVRGGDIEIVNVPIPRLEKPNQILIQMQKVGICHTDLHVIDGCVNNHLLN